jgi:hypothetical protein
MPHRRRAFRARHYRLDNVVRLGNGRLRLLRFGDQFFENRRSGREWFPGWNGNFGARFLRPQVDFDPADFLFDGRLIQQDGGRNLMRIERLRRHLGDRPHRGGSGLCRDGDGGERLRSILGLRSIRERGPLLDGRL